MQSGSSGFPSVGYSFCLLMGPQTLHYNRMWCLQKRSKFQVLCSFLTGRGRKNFNRRTSLNSYEFQVLKVLNSYISINIKHFIRIKSTEKFVGSEISGATNLQTILVQISWQCDDYFTNNSGFSDATFVFWKQWIKSNFVCFLIEKKHPSNGSSSLRHTVCWLKARPFKRPNAPVVHKRWCHRKTSK